MRNKLCKLRREFYSRCGCKARTICLGVGDERPLCEWIIESLIAGSFALELSNEEREKMIGELEKIDGLRLHIAKYGEIKFFGMDVKLGYEKTHLT